MPSQVEGVASALQQLVWNSILERVLTKLAPVFAIPILGFILRQALEKYVIAPLFEEAARWGVFGHIDWESDEIYEGYRLSAQQMAAAQSVPGEWNAEERQKFRARARELINLGAAIKLRKNPN